MAIKKNWFTNLTLVLFEICIAYALLSGVMDMAGPGAYRFLWYGGIICVFAAALVLVHVASKYTARLNVPLTLARNARKLIIAERIVVAAVMLAGAVIRVWVTAKLPIAPSSDYQTYYQVAGLLSKGALGGSGYSGYIAEFPHVIGYPFILSLLFRITGPSVQAGLYLNLAASLISVFLTYRIARTLCGRLGGIIALLIAAFWPSQILYGAILASEPVFTCMLLVCVWLFIYLYRYPVSLGNREGAIFLCFILGAALALTNAVRPLSEILLVAVILSFIPFTRKFDKNERMLNGRLSRASCQGWFIALMVSLSFFVCGQFISASISHTIAYKLPGAGVSFGYNLMVGVNIDAKGAWNQQDADFFASEFAATNSAEAAHKASVDVALGRIGSDPLGVLNLGMEKFTYLWGNDDYAATWTSLFLSQQGNLTPERQEIIDRFSVWNDCFYMLALFFSAVFGLQQFKRKDTGPAQALVLLFVGTAILHMILESQNRYHYFILPVFAILASMSVAEVYHSHAGPKTDRPS